MTLQYMILVSNYYIIIGTNSIIVEKCYNKGECEWRRNHVAQTIGKQMILFGGITESGSFADDINVLDMTTFRWTKIYAKGSRPGPIAFMASCLVIQPERKRINDENFDIYKLPDVSTKSSFKKLKLEGLYIFGGLNKDYKPLDELRVLRLGKKPLDWIKPACQGKRPSARYSCTINFYEDLSILILHGGQNSITSDIIYCDTFVLDLFTFVWTEVKLYDSDPFPRSEFSSAIINSKLIILGGTDTMNYSTMDLYIISLNFYEKRHGFTVPQSLKISHMKNPASTISNKLVKPNEVTDSTPNNNLLKEKPKIHAVPKESAKYLRYVKQLKNTIKKDEAMM